MGGKGKRRRSKRMLGKKEEEKEENVKDGTVRWLINLCLAVSQHNLMSFPTNREGIAIE